MYPGDRCINLTLRPRGNYHYDMVKGKKGGVRFA